MSKGIKRIAVSVEHVRGWGRRVCEGIADYLHGHPEWRISMFERVLGTTVQREIMSNGASRNDIAMIPNL